MKCGQPGSAILHEIFAVDHGPTAHPKTLKVLVAQVFQPALVGRASRPLLIAIAKSFFRMIII